jgi:hypothetical protein
MSYFIFQESLDVASATNRSIDGFSDRTWGSTPAAFGMLVVIIG